MTNAPMMSWVFEIVGPLVWLGLAVYFVQQFRQRAHVLRNALILIASTTMFWQEWFGDWGNYIIFNPGFALMPWGTTTWTTPNKPWAVIFAYGWFFTLAFLAFFWLMDRLVARRPDIRPGIASILVGIPLFYFVDLVVEGGATVFGWWSYDNFVGPALQTPNGNFPLIYPVIYVAAWCTIQGWLIYQVDTDGLTRLDRLMGMRRLLGNSGAGAGKPRPLADGGDVVTATLPERTRQLSSPTAQVIRVLAWIIGFNASYWILLMFPMVILRVLTGHESTLVP